MQVIIDGRTAVLKQDTSFEYISENRLFTDSDGYSLKIEFPLAGCPENIEIFGRLTRMERKPEKIFFEAQIIDRSLRLRGALAIISFDNKTVSGQFLEGRSADNYYSILDKIYIDELDLGEPPYVDATADTNRWDAINPENFNTLKCVALPWVNDSAEGFLNNAWNAPLKIDENGIQSTDRFNQDAIDVGISWQTWLIFIAKRICSEIGYTCNFSEWENSELKYLLVCNTLPGSWDMPGFANALPHWTVKEFFDNIGDFLYAEFDINSSKKYVGMRFSKDITKESGFIELNNILDDFSTENDISEDVTSKYKGSKVLKYPDRDDDEWKLLCCPGGIDYAIKKTGTDVIEYETYNEFKNDYIQYRSFQNYDEDSNFHRHGNTLPNIICYIKELDTYYTLIYKSKRIKGVTWTGRVYVYVIDYVTRPIPLNIFGVEEEDTEDLAVCPVRIAHTDENYQQVMFLAPNAMSDETENLSREDDTDDKDYLNRHLTNLDTSITRTMKSYTKTEKGSGFYDEIFVAFYGPGIPTIDISNAPIVDYSEVNNEWNPAARYIDKNNPKKVSIRRTKEAITENYQEIDYKQKTTVKFLSEELPDVRAIFLIKGRRYLCEKITTTFSDKGRSKLMKGVFYPLV